MAHSRSERRASRRRVVARRVSLAYALWSDARSFVDTGRAGRWAKFNPHVCCAMCQSDEPYPGRWRWDGVLDEEGFLVREPEWRDSGMR